MIKNNIPIYEVIFNEETFLTAISLVDKPAIESDFQYFSKQEQFQIINQEEHKVLGCILRADFPIYRLDGDYEFYITFSKDIISKMAQKYMKDGFQNCVTLDHKYPTDSLEIIQFFIKNTDKGVNPCGFEDIKDGSLFAEFKVNNVDIWNEIKDGHFKGFSVECFLDMKKVENNNVVTRNNMSKLERIKSMIKNMLVEFSQISTDKAIIGYDADDIVIDTKVYGIDGNGEKYDIEDGVYSTENEVYTIENGIVKDIQPVMDEVVAEPEPEVIEEKEEVIEEENIVVNEEPEIEETTEEEVVEDVVEEDKISDMQKVIDELTSEIESLKAEIEKKDAQIKELEAKEVSMSATEEFKSVNKISKTGIRKLDNLARILNA